MLLCLENELFEDKHITGFIPCYPTQQFAGSQSSINVFELDRTRPPPSFFSINDFIYFAVPGSSLRHAGSLVVVCRLLICGMRDLLIVPPSVIEPGPLALGARSLSHWTTREVLWATTFFGNENLGGHELLQGNKLKTWGLKARGTGQVSLQPIPPVLPSCPSPPGGALSPSVERPEAVARCMLGHHPYNPCDRSPCGHHPYSLPLIALILYQM